MLALRDLQEAFAAHLTGADRPDLMNAVVSDAIPAAARLRIHRHHVTNSLATALTATFPTVQAIVGEDFFQTMARAFVAQDLPRQPVLAEYGAGFPAYVADYGLAATLPYLADMAQLDWALNLAFQTPASGRLAAEDLAGIEPERLLGMRLTLAAGSTLLRSPYPIDRIWHASQPGATGGPVTLDEGPASVVVIRRTDDAAFASLTPAEVAFASALDGGRTLEEGAEAGFAIDSAFDLTTTFGRLLALQAFAALQQEAKR